MALGDPSNRVSYPQQLPLILSLKEVERILRVPPHQKSRALLMTIYATGLRISEVVLRVSQVSLECRSTRTEFACRLSEVQAYSISSSVSSFFFAFTGGAALSTGAVGSSNPKSVSCRRKFPGLVA
jgi:hypothetical protein